MTDRELAVHLATVLTGIAPDSHHPHAAVVADLAARFAADPDLMAEARVDPDAVLATLVALALETVKAVIARPVAAAA